MEIAIIIFVFLITFLIVYRLSVSFSPNEKKSKRRIAELVDTEDSFSELQSNLGEGPSDFSRSLEGMVRPFRNVEGEYDNLRLRLMQAGWTSPSAPALHLFASTFGWVLGIITLFAIYILARDYQGVAFYAFIVCGLIIASIFAFGADLALRSSIDKRKAVLVRSFPDALDLLLVCVESGLALDAALARVCKELEYAHPEITAELNRTRLELTMLNDREKALHNLAVRTDITAVKSLVAALLQSEKFGTSLVETLRVLSDDYRQTRMMIAEEKAGKLPAKIAVASIPPMLIALLILILTPAILEFMKEFKKMQ
ncbi:MAG: type II secretion system protein [Alphaproteobacteria bacterium CG11_big_fil_rev_8_21_14_0_20_44_7]|nr:MAG: type II secretion system protein [Alphaproteobacteria bacterium CG11_big_fil_rev_8_21_14_0_20_44_7]